MQGGWLLQTQMLPGVTFAFELTARILNDGTGQFMDPVTVTF
jgi:hypothetical protein